MLSRQFKTDEIWGWTLTSLVMLYDRYGKGDEKSIKCIVVINMCDVVLSDSIPSYNIG